MSPVDDNRQVRDRGQSRTSAIDDTARPGAQSRLEDARPGADLVGLRVTLREHDGRTILGSLQPLFRGEEGPIAGEVHGLRRGPVVEIGAAEGWSVAGVVVVGSDRVDGVALLYASADGSATAFSEWIGGRGGRETLLGGPGTRVVGVRGRCGHDLDALGIVLGGGRK